MNRKQFVILFVLLVVLGGAGWLVQQNRNREAGAGEEGSGAKVVGEAFPINDVASIHIQQGSNECNLVKKDDLWRVRERFDYPANFTTISELLLKVRDLKVVQTEEIGASDLPGLQLAPQGQGTNSGTVLEFKDKDGKTIKNLTLGKKHMGKPNARQMQFGMGEEGFPDGRYLLVGSDTSKALLISDPLANVEPGPAEWLDKTFFRVERPKAVALTSPEPTNSWKIIRSTETGDWTLSDLGKDEKLDAARVSGVSSPFASPSINDILAGAGNAADGYFTNSTTLTVDTFDDLTYTVRVGTKTNNDYPISLTVAANFPKERIPAKDEKPEDKDKADKAWKDRQKQIEDKFKDAQRFQNWVFLTPSWSVDPLLKSRKDLLEEKKEEPKPAEKAPEDKPVLDTPSPLLPK